jgi:glycosyltransferase involved in cell wall biosynthesis
MTTPTNARSHPHPTPGYRPTLCLVAHYAYGAISGGQHGHVGGVEWQTSLMARWFAARGYPVALLTWDEGQRDDEEFDGVRVIKICRRSAGLPGIRFFHPRWTGLCRALHAAQADVYYHNCAEYVTGQVALWCRYRGVPFIYSVASDPDCDPRLPEMHTLRERTLYRYGLRHADHVIVQTGRQRDMLAAGFRRASTVIPMPCPGPSATQYVAPQLPTKGARVAWVGRVVELKRLDWLLELAAAMPDINFDVVGGPDVANTYSQELLGRAAAQPNITLHGRVARQHMPGIYRRACCLCCTSRFEGFPNTFLEAFSHGLPVVSTIDPDGLIARRRLGATANDIPALRSALRTLLSSPALWQEASANARRYYLENHTVEAVLPRFEDVFLRAAAQRLPFALTTSQS